MYHPKEFHYQDSCLSETVVTHTQKKPVNISHISSLAVHAFGSSYIFMKAKELKWLCLFIQGQDKQAVF